MAKNEIVEKLQALLSRPVTEEAHVAYFMMEVRKIIEQDNSSAKYPLLKFYADWANHSEKDKITPEIESMSEDMYAYTARVINSPHGFVDEKSKVLEFAYMESLSTEVATFLVDVGITSDLATDKGKWTDFASLLVKILEEQPINSPSQNVQKIVFEKANPRCTALTVVFKQPVGGYSHFTMKNAY